MKSLVYTLGLILTSFVWGQDTEYIKVDYKTTYSTDNDFKQQAAFMTPDQLQELKSVMKKGISTNYILISDGKKSSFTAEQKIITDKGMVGLIKQQILNQDKGSLIKDYEKNEYTKPYDIMGTKYLVKDELIDFNWKITREKKEISGYLVKKAIATTKDSMEYTAWFTPKLASKDGPDRAWGLPGLILQLNYTMKEYNIEMKASKISTINNASIKENKGGKELTSKEFEAEMKALQEKMKAMYGGLKSSDN